MTIELLVITPDQTMQGVTIDDSQDELSVLQDIVGGFIEVIPVNHQGRETLMVINEEGKLHGLPLNILATRYIQSKHDTSDYIVGNVAIITKGELQ